MPIRAIAYTSRAVAGLSLHKVEEITRQAAAFNEAVGLTGVILFDGARFLQYVEGPEEVLRAGFLRILMSSCHGDVHQFGFQRTSGRIFPSWSMRWLAVESTALSHVADGDWTSFQNGGSHGAGLERLMTVVAPHAEEARSGNRVYSRPEASRLME